MINSRVYQNTIVADQLHERKQYRALLAAVHISVLKHVCQYTNYD